LKFILSSQKHEREHLKKAIFILKTNPIPVRYLDIVKLKGEKNKYRIRKGKFRIVYFNRYTPQLCCGWVCRRNV